ncbi:MAG: hypothetical protein AABW51_03775 [Nanoarchaeota archaeon]
MKITKDKYLRKRGGTAKIIKISCIKCGSEIFIYQKDGVGWLKRCYLNRIIGPKREIYPEKLLCKCRNLIGTLTKHKDERLAYALIRGKFKRTNFKTK